MKEERVNLPLAVVWSPHGPWCVEMQDVSWDAVAVFPDLLAAARKASRIVKHDWKVHGFEWRVRVDGPKGAM